MSLLHMRILRTLMLSVGSWPRGALRGRTDSGPYFYYRFYRWFETALLTVGEVIYLSDHTELSFYIMGNLIITLSLSCLMLVRNNYPLFKQYGEIFKVFIHKFHLCNFRHNHHVEDILKDTTRITNILTIATMVLALSGAFSFALSPLFNLFLDKNVRKLENVQMHASIVYQYPHFKQEDHVNLCFFLNIWFAYVTAIAVTSTDSFLTAIVFQIIGHMKYLRTILDNFPRPPLTTLQCQPNQYNQELGSAFETVQHFDDKQNETIKYKLMNCVKHHLFIVEFTVEISGFFGPLLAFNYFFHLFTLCLLMAECMQGWHAILNYGPVTMMTVTELLTLSITYEIVHSESEKLRDAVYFLPWESMSIGNQKSVALILRNMHTPMAVTALGLTPVGVRTMASIMKTSVSYCAFLRSSSTV